MLKCIAFLQFTVQQIEVWSMLPPRMLRIQPHHEVLDLCASPGFMASQITEIMYSNPNIVNGKLNIPNGKLNILNGNLNIVYFSPSQ